MFEAGPVAVVMDVDEPSRKSALFVLPQSRQAPEPSCAVSNYALIEKMREESLEHRARPSCSLELPWVMRYLSPSAVRTGETNYRGLALMVLVNLWLLCNIAVWIEWSQNVPEDARAYVRVHVGFLSGASGAWCVAHIHGSWKHRHQTLSDDIMDIADNQIVGDWIKCFFWDDYTVRKAVAVIMMSLLSSVAFAMHPAMFELSIWWQVPNFVFALLFFVVGYTWVFCFIVVNVCGHVGNIRTLAQQIAASQSLIAAAPSMYSLSASYGRVNALLARTSNLDGPTVLCLTLVCNLCVFASVAAAAGLLHGTCDLEYCSPSVIAMMGVTGPWGVFILVLAYQIELEHHQLLLVLALHPVVPQQDTQSVSILMKHSGFLRAGPVPFTQTTARAVIAILVSICTTTLSVAGITSDA